MAPDGGGRYTFPMLTRRALIASALAAPAAAQVNGMAMMRAPIAIAQSQALLNAFQVCNNPICMGFALQNTKGFKHQVFGFGL